MLNLGPEYANYYVCETKDDVLTCIALLSSKNVISVDTETSGLDAYRSKLVGFVFGCSPDIGIYVPVGHRNNPDIGIESLTLCKNFIENSPNIEKVFHNLKFDLKSLQREGIFVSGVVHDTLVLSKLLEIPLNSYALKSLAKSILKKETKGKDDLSGWITEHKQQVESNGYGIIPYELLGRYACEDGIFTIQLFEHYKEKLREAGEELEALYEVEIEVIKIAKDMEDRGHLLDLEYLKKYSATLEEERKQIAEQAKQYLKGANIASNKQIAACLLSNGVELTHKTESGEYKVTEEVLKDIEHPLAKLVLDYRKKEKIKATYVDSLLEKSINGIIHPSFNTIAAETGRFSCSDPNLQNIPRSADSGVRAAFIARPGTSLFYFDFSQQELRVFAHYAKDKFLMNLIKEGGDFHGKMAEALGVERHMAKTIVFGLMYGMGAKKLALQLNISEEMAKAHISTFFKRVSTAKKLLGDTQKVSFGRGYIKSLFGRRRWLHYKDIQGHEVDESRKALNTLIQGSSATITKVCMVKCKKLLNIENKHPYPLGVWPLLQIHDEIVFEVPEGQEGVVPVLKETMEYFPMLKIPMLVEVSQSKTNWTEKKKVTEEQLEEWKKKKVKILPLNMEDPYNIIPKNNSIKDNFTLL